MMIPKFKSAYIIYYYFLYLRFKETEGAVKRFNKCNNKCMMFSESMSNFETFIISIMNRIIMIFWYVDVSNTEVLSLQ